MDIITALDICTDPDGLSFTITQDKESGKYGLIIARRSEDGCRRFVFERPCSHETQEAVLEMLRTVLQGARDKVSDELRSPSSLAAVIFGAPADQPLEKIELTQAKIDEIIKALKTQGSCLIAASNSARPDQLAKAGKQKARKNVGAELVQPITL